MRLRWTSPDPHAAAALLAKIAGPARRADPSVFLLDGVSIEVVAGTSRDDRLELADEDGPPSLANHEPHAPFGLVALGIATVDTDRFAAEAGWPLSALAVDDTLGAFASRVVGHPFVLLEPRTEGRLAATLARLGEGPVSLYLRPLGRTLIEARAAVAAAGGGTTTVTEGPFGREWAFRGRSTFGPHLIVVEGSATAGTIAP